MQKLKILLDQSKIPYRCRKHAYLQGEYLEYLDAATGTAVCSVIDGGKGCELGLLQMDGLISKADTWDSVLGCLTAEKVFQRILRHYRRLPTLFPEYVTIRADTATIAPGIPTVFDDFFEKNDIIKKIILPEGVTCLNTGFRACTALEDICFPSTLKEIPSGAFENSGLKQVTFSFGTEVIRENAFMGCKRLERVRIPGSVRRIEDSAFWLCSLREVILDEGIRSIGFFAFAENPMTGVVIPKSVDDLDDMAFVDEQWEPIEIIYK